MLSKRGIHLTKTDTSTGVMEVNKSSSEISEESAEESETLEDSSTDGKEELLDLICYI